MCECRKIFKNFGNFLQILEDISDVKCVRNNWVSFRSHFWWQMNITCQWKEFDPSLNMFHSGSCLRIVCDFDVVRVIFHTAEKLPYLSHNELFVPAVVSELSSRTIKQYFVWTVHIIGAYGRLWLSWNCWHLYGMQHNWKEQHSKYRSACYIHKIGSEIIKLNLLLFLSLAASYKIHFERTCSKRNIRQHLWNSLAAQSMQ